MKTSTIDVSRIPGFDLSEFVPDRIQSRALKTWGIPDSPEGQLVHSIIGLAGESGELLDKIKKGLFKPGYGLKPEDVIKEAGDILYYLAVLTSLMGLTLEDLSVMNRAKLKGGAHGWAENQGEDMVVFTLTEAKERIDAAVADSNLPPAQFNSVVMGILKGVENKTRNEVTVEFKENVHKRGFDMAVRNTHGVGVLFHVFLPEGRVLDIQRG